MQCVSLECVVELAGDGVKQKNCLTPGGIDFCPFHLDNDRGDYNEIIMDMTYSDGLAVNETCSSKAQAIDGAEYRTLLTNAKGIIVDVCMF